MPALADCLFLWFLRQTAWLHGKLALPVSYSSLDNLEHASGSGLSRI